MEKELERNLSVKAKRERKKEAKKETIEKLRKELEKYINICIYIYREWERERDQAPLSVINIDTQLKRIDIFRYEPMFVA